MTEPTLNHLTETPEHSIPAGEEKEDAVTFSNVSKTIHVSKPVLTEENGIVTLSAQVSGGVTGRCFYSTDAANRDYVDENSSDCFLIGLLYTAMYAGCSLVLDGEVSEKLFFRTKFFLMPILEAYFEGQIQTVDIQAASLRSEVYPQTDVVGTGFSGGIDSFHTIREFYLDYDGPPRDRVNTLLFFNVGSHGMGRDPKRLAWLENKFAERRKALNRYAEEIGLPFIAVNSNIHAFMQSGHLQTSTLASLSAALFLGRKLRLYYLASMGISYHGILFPDSREERDYSIARIETFLLPHICTESFSAVSGGSACTRVQKTEAICHDPHVQKYLNVCGNQNVVTSNCSNCYKCKRTMMTLELLGVLPRFKDVFDLERFSSRERSRYIATILNNRKKDLFLQDLYDLAERKHYDLRSRTSLLVRLYMKFTETGFYAFLRRNLRREH